MMAIREEEVWAKLIGFILALLMLIFLGIGLMLAHKALDDGPAPRPSEWRKG